MFDKLWARGNNLRATREATDYLFKNFLYLGLQHPEKWQRLHKLYSLILNLFVLGWYPISFIVSYYFEFRNMTVSQLLTSIQVAFNVWGIPFKIATMLMSLRHLYETMDVMDILDARCDRQDEREKIRHCVMVGNRLTMVYMLVYCTYAEVTLIASVSMGQPPYSLYIPGIEWRNSKQEFAAQCVIEFVLTNLACCHEAAEDVYSVIYVYVIRTHMQILVERVRRLGKDLETTNDECYEQLAMCVKDHQNLLRLIDIISPVISKTIFIQFMITAIILGTTLINIMIFADFSAQVASVVYMLAVLVQTFPCCYQATCLMEDSQQLTLAIFHCEWIDKDIRTRKMLIFFMMRSQLPVTLTALKLFPITLDTSLAIGKFSFSLYTLIKEMDFGQNFKA
ncbi:odorant receptor 7a-like [Calliphora vicina]|uniref:odorant receptor 7a-like n=1 Tax=Calliphora vicina TaxID=7373 RepID=UPI00325A7EAF